VNTAYILALIAIVPGFLVLVANCGLFPTVGLSAVRGTGNTELETT
jgi:hypothetical protein